MLREDVVRAAKDGQFRVYAVDDVDQAVELLTGMEAGAPDDEGVFAEGTFNRLVADQLAEMAEVAKRLAKESKSEDNSD